MEIKVVPLSELKTNPDNPRTISDANLKKLVKSLKDFPKMLDAREVVVNDDYVILGGNMRYEAAKAAGLTELPVKIAHGWTEAEQKEFIAKDNISYGDWDWDILNNEWDTDLLEAWGLSVNPATDDDFYTRNITPPTYEPVDQTPDIETLVDTTKRDELVAEINSTDIPSPVKDFLTLGAQRHLVFDYASIADYYANADADIQALMEKSALVLIDFHQAIELGYVDLTKNLAELTETDYAD